MQQFIKYFMNMRLLARRAEYARGAASGADVLRFFCAPKQRDFRGARKPQACATLLGIIMRRSFARRIAAGQAYGKQGSGRAAPLGNLLSIKHLNYFKTR